MTVKARLYACRVCTQNAYNAVLGANTARESAKNAKTIAVLALKSATGAF